MEGQPSLEFWVNRDLSADKRVTGRKGPNPAAQEELALSLQGQLAVQVVVRGQGGGSGLGGMRGSLLMELEARRMCVSISCKNV